EDGSYDRGAAPRLTRRPRERESLLRRRRFRVGLSLPQRVARVRLEVRPLLRRVILPRPADGYLVDLLVGREADGDGQFALAQVPAGAGDVAPQRPVADLDRQLRPDG